MKLLDSGWTLTGESVSGPVAAKVPGTVHTDLLAAGLIKDPYLATNEADLARFHRSSWRYDLSLEADPATDDERVDVVFEGIDTVATILLDDEVLGRTANMHRSYRFDVRNGRHLRVQLDSALAYAEKMAEELGPRPHVNKHPYNAVRKMACSFGWDWGPDLQTAGLWRPVSLHRWRVARLASVRPLVTLDEDGTGRARIHVGIERSGLGPNGPVSVRAALDGFPHATGEVTVGAAETEATLELTLPDAPVWWPAGYGSQPLVALRIDLLDAGQVLDTYARRIGFRSVRVDETDGAFTLVVNGRPVFVRGLNWIPEDHFLVDIDYRPAVERAAAANANLLRVWGGGIFESREFYEACDELGIMVWQDFLLACAAYAEEEPLRSEILAEVRENVTRLAPHPSLVLWNGGNENLWGHEDWGWKEQLGDRTWGPGYYYDEFPALLAELDPSRPYHPGSPSSPGSFHPNDDRYGTRHEWEVWNKLDYSAYRNHRPRFCSEFGWQAPPTWATLTRAVPELRKDSPAFLTHQKAEDGTGKLDRGLAHHFDVPERFEDWHWATQLNQARALTVGVEHFRAGAPRTMGAVWWQLNDCWPVTSWAVVDGDGRLKPAWYALRRAYAPRLLTVQPSGVVLVNDTAAPWRGSLRLRRLRFDGTVLAEDLLPFVTDARSAHTLPETLHPAGDPASEVLVAEADGYRALHFFAEDRDLAYTPQPFDASAAARDDGYEVTVTATAFVRDLALLADRCAPDAVADDQLITLLPGEHHTFRVRTTADIAPDELVSTDVLRSANQLVIPVR